MNPIPLSQQPITDAHLELRRGIRGKGYTLCAKGHTHPDATTLSIAARARALVHAALKPFEVIIACFASALAGYVFYAPFLESHLEDQVPARLYGPIGALISLVVLTVIAKLFTLYFENLHAHRQSRAKGWTYLALITVIAVLEAAAIANGLAGQTGSSVLDPFAAFLPYLAGGLLTALNLGAGWFLGKRLGEGHVIHQAALELLETHQYQNGPEGVIEARARLRLLHANADRTHFLPDVTQPVADVTQPMLNETETPRATPPEPVPPTIKQRPTIQGFGPQGDPS